jgi:hypothetical protein
MYNPSTREVIKRVCNATAAGTSNVNCTAVDLTSIVGDIVRVIACFGTLTATQVTGLKLQTSPDNSTWTDLTGGATAAMADGDSNKMLIAEWVRPNTKYVRAVVTRGTANAVIDSVVVLVGNTRAEPITADSSVSASVVVGPSY